MHRVIILVVSSALLLLSLNCFGAILFQENFDSLPDWNVDNKFVDECSGNCKNAPRNWSNFRTVPGSMLLKNPTGSIRRLPNNLPDHSSGSGKAYIVFNQSVVNINWPGDSILLKVLPHDYDEIFARFWLRTQPAWQSVPSSQLKVFRILHWDRTGNIFQFSTYSSPIFFWDLAVSGNNRPSYLTAYRCGPKQSNYYCTAPSVPFYQKNDIFYPIPFNKTTSPGAYADTQWHKYDFHVKLNNVGANDGVMEWWYDGKLVERRTNVQWLSEGSSSVGWNSFAIGGNSNNTFLPLADQWYAIDDVVISTTPIPQYYKIPNN